MISLSDATVNYRGHKPVLNWFMTLDIETSDNRTISTAPSLCWSYQQGLMIYDYLNDTAIGYKETRNIVDVCNLIVNVSEELTNLDADALMYCFIHNMPFDMSYLRLVLIDAFKNKYGDNFNLEEKYMTSGRPLFIKFNNIEFRCSYNLYNSTLYEFTRDMNVKHKKLLGANDYGVHYSDEELSKDFHDYQQNDCWGLAEAITALGHQEDYKLANLPYTFTSFNRKSMIREFRKTKAGEKVNIDEIRNFEARKPTVKEYNLITKARRGGFVIAAPNYIGVDITKDMISYDFASMYTACMLYYDYPASKGHYVALSNTTKAARKQLIADAVTTKLAVMRLSLKNPRLKPGKHIPFLKLNSSIRTYGINDDDCIMYNNLVISIKSNTWVDTTVVSPDARIILSIYDFDDIDVSEIFMYDSGKLSHVITNKALELFTTKTIAKVNYRNADTLHKPEAVRKLVQAKIKLNNLAGILQESPDRPDVEVDDEGKITVLPQKINDILSHDDAARYTRLLDALDKHYTAYSSGKCFSYTDGVFMLAYAHELLFKVFDAIGHKNLVYADTDSAYFIKNAYSLKAIQRLNEKFIKRAKDRNAYATVDGKDYYIGEFMLDHDNIKRFKAIAPKRYIFTDGENVYATLSGILNGVGLHEEPDKDGIPTPVYTYTREMELCGIPYSTPRKPTADDIKQAFINFDDGYKFKICSGTTSRHLYHKPEVVNINGHTEMVAGGVCLLQSERAIYKAKNIKQLVNEDVTTRRMSDDVIITIKPTLAPIIQ